jgi:hypothetical protein
MKTQIIKTAQKPEVTHRVGDLVKFRYQIQEQNIGWTYEHTTGCITKVNRVTVNVLDGNDNLWRVNKEDIVK